MVFALATAGDYNKKTRILRKKLNARNGMPAECTGCSRVLVWRRTLTRGCGLEPRTFHIHMITTLGKLFRHMHHCAIVPLLPSSIIWYWPNGGDVVQLER